MITGGNGDDYLKGKGDGDDRVYGDAGADTVIGGDGNDVIRVGADGDVDVVVLDADDGTDRVFEFDSELDLIRLLGDWANDPALSYTLVVKPENGDAILTYGATTATIFNYATGTEILIDRDGINDGPVATAIDAGTVTEDDAPQTIDLLATARDADGDVLAAAAISLDDGFGNAAAFTDNGDGTITIDPALFDALAAGDSRTLTVSYTVDDGNGGTVANTATLKVTGVNDAAGIGAGAGPLGGSTLPDTDVTEDTDGVASGQLTITDVDTGEAEFVAQTNAAGAYGTFQLTANGTWSYALANADPAVQALGAGVTATDTLTVAALDGTTYDLDVTITGTNDAAIIGGGATDDTAVTEDADAAAGGQLTITDVDTGEAAFVAQTNAAGAYGTFQLAADGTWSYALDNADPAVQALAAGDTATDTLTVAALDGTTYDLDVTITGTNDAAVIAAGAADDTSVTEDTDAAAGGQLTNTDVETGEAEFVAQTNPAGAHGTFQFAADGTWSYALDNDAATVQALAGGDTVFDDFTVETADGTTTTLSVAVAEADEPVVTEPSTTIRQEQTVNFKTSRSTSSRDPRRRTVSRSKLAEILIAPSRTSMSTSKGSWSETTSAGRPLMHHSPVATPTFIH